jgi:hypothetical protein
MKAKVFYQEFCLNGYATASCELVVDQDNAVFVREYDFTKGTREKFIDEIFRTMNMLNIPPDHPERPLFEKAGHTSMSIGDYIRFDDGTVMVVSPVGWKAFYNCPETGILKS